MLCASFTGGAAVALNPAKNIAASAAIKANRFITPVLIQNVEAGKAALTYRRLIREQSK